MVLSRLSAAVEGGIDGEDEATTMRDEGGGSRGKVAAD